MSNARSFVLVGLLALAVLAPTVTAVGTPGIVNPNSSSPTKLFFHLGANQDFPINTQEPPMDGYTRDDHFGTGTNSLQCVPDPSGQGGLYHKNYHTFYGFSSPGYVEYNYTENGGPRIHPERGLSFDVNLDPAVKPVVYFYITTFTGTPGSGSIPNVDPVVPHVVAAATVRTGEKITLDDTGYNVGEVIASGKTHPTTLAGGQKAIDESTNTDSTQVTVEPGQPGTAKAAIYQFKIPLEYAKTQIPKESGYSVRIDFYQELPNCNQGSNDDKIMPNVMNTHTSPKHRPRLELAVMNAVRIEYMHPQFVGDDMVIHTSENSPWGNYDVDERPSGINIAIEGPNGPVQGVYRAAVVQRYHEHDHHTQAVDVTFVWPYKSLNAPDGKYTISLDVTNDQGSAKATGVALFQIGKDLIVTKCGALGLNAGAESNQKCKDEIQDTNGNALTAPAKKSANLELVGVIAAIGAVAVLARRKD